MSKIRVSAVSYTNTKPFIYGLEHSDILNDIDLSLDIPSDCARKLIENKADIGLVPVAALLQIPDFKIVSDYCIGATGAVNSVFIFSNKPIQEIKTLRLDSESRTSNALARVLLKNYWNLNPELVTVNEDAFVEIGDRTFGKKAKYPFVYDLAEHWMNFTGLPFVFAVWAANKPINQDIINKLNTAFKFGVDNRQAVIPNIIRNDNFDLEDYLMHKIDFHFNDDKRIALDKFLDYVINL